MHLHRIMSGFKRNKKNVGSKQPFFSVWGTQSDFTNFRSAWSIPKNGILQIRHDCTFGHQCSCFTLNADANNFLRETIS